MGLYQGLSLLKREEFSRMVAASKNSLRASASDFRESQSVR